MTLTSVLPKVEVKDFIAEEQKTVDQWNNYASSMNALNKRMGGTKNILELKRNPYLT
jgi:hypothetical protein